MIANLEHIDAGEGDVVLCLHGIGGGAESFRAMMDAMVSPPDGGDPLGGALPLPNPPRGISGQMKGDGVRVISVGLPGYGASVANLWPPSFESMSVAVGHVIEALGAPVHLVGHSIGGMIGLEHAIRRPDHVRSLCLMGVTPSFGGRDDSFRDAFLRARLAPLEAGQTMAEMARAATPHLVGAGTSTAVIDEIAAIMGQVSVKTWRGILECLVTFNRRADLGGVVCPCCLIAGELDQNAPARTMQKMAEALPDAAYHQLAKTGHMIPQEAPAACAAIVREFVGKQQ